MSTPTMIIESRDRVLCRDLRRLVPRRGYEVIELSGLGELIRSLENSVPDLIIIGSSRKGAMDGLEAVREVRRHDPKIPIILVTSPGLGEFSSEVLRIGANDYLEMPVAREDLAASIKRSLSGLYVKSGIIVEPTVADPLGNAMIGLKDFPGFFCQQLQETKGPTQDERSRLLSALFNTKWNETEAAQQLQWSRTTLYRKMNKFGVPSLSDENGQQRLITLKINRQLN